MLNSVCFSVSHGPLFKGPSLFSSTFFQGKSPSVSFNLWLLRDCVSTPEMNFWSYKQKQDRQEKLPAVLSLSPHVTSHHPYWLVLAISTEFRRVCLHQFVSSVVGCDTDAVSDWQVTDKVQCQSNWRAFGKNKSILNSLHLNLQKAFLALTFIKPFQFQRLETHVYIKCDYTTVQQMFL